MAVSRLRRDDARRDFITLSKRRQPDARRDRSHATCASPGGPTLCARRLGCSRRRFRTSPAPMDAGVCTGTLLRLAAARIDAGRCERARDRLAIHLAAAGRRELRAPCLLAARHRLVGIGIGRHARAGRRARGQDRAKRDGQHATAGNSLHESSPLVVGCCGCEPGVSGDSRSLERCSARQFGPRPTNCWRLFFRLQRFKRRPDSLPGRTRRAAHRCRSRRDEGTRRSGDRASADRNGSAPC